MSESHSTILIIESQQPRGYRGLTCPCKACSKLSPEQRIEKALHIAEARRRGGRTRSAQPSMKEARVKAFWTTMDLHPFFARNHLKTKIKLQNQRRQRIVGMRVLIVGLVRQPRRPR